MDLLHAIILALVQGVTEFLPISSSAHLILFPAFAGWQQHSLAFDVALHVGTLSAVVWYFRVELARMAAAWLRSIRGGGATADSRLAWGVLWGTVPVGLVGLLFNDLIETNFRQPLLIAAVTALFAVPLWLADVLGPRRRDEHTLGWRDVAAIGIAQALALIPGVSRSGITMTAGLALGLTRAAAARFSFLLSIPVIVLAGALEAVQLIQTRAPADWRVLTIGAAVAAISAYLCIKLFLTFLERTGMLPFAIYRLLLAVLIAVVFIR
ncbi:undecaprenyl-diphosphate phosphatase [soil metagenome]